MRDITPIARAPLAERITQWEHNTPTEFTLEEALELPIPDLRNAGLATRTIHYIKNNIRTPKGATLRKLTAYLRSLNIILLPPTISKPKSPYSLAELRKFKGMTQLEVARHLGISRNNYQFIESSITPASKEVFDKLTALFSDLTPQIEDLSVRQEKPTYNLRELRQHYGMAIASVATLLRIPVEEYAAIEEDISLAPEEILQAIEDLFGAGTADA